MIGPGPQPLDAVGGGVGRFGSPDRPAPRGGRPPQTDRRGPGPVVLLVDDLEDQRELYRQYLEFADYQVSVARDGYEAIDRALRLKPDVVIMDLAMPGLDGFEATQRLKLLEATRGIPVIALTAHGALPREWALSAGCVAYLKKPCYPHDLAVEIASALAQTQSSRRASVSASLEALRAHVMVVGGSVGDRELFAEYLEYRGCLVSVSIEVGTALREAQRLQPAVIVLDLDAPGRPGLDVLRDLRRSPGTRDIPIVGLSRHAADAQREEVRSLGGVLLAKPCEPEALYREVRKAAAASRHGPD